MKLNLLGIIDILFPRSADERLLEDCTVEQFLSKYDPHTMKDICALSSFADAESRAARQRNKFHNHPKAQELLAGLLALWLCSLSSEGYVLVPLPLSSKRERERGYNQVTVIAQKALRSNSQIKLVTNLLIKNKHTPAQTTLTKAQRHSNVENVFTVHAHGNVPDKTMPLVLLDDVTTTGATLFNAKKSLRKAGYTKVICVALAH